MQAAGRSGVSTDEINRFDALADRWWDADGPMRALHWMNPIRIGWIDAHIRKRFAMPIRLLDVGCGAGLAAEALARRGHDVVGIDVALGPVLAARAHAESRGLSLVYREAVPEDLLAEGSQFPVITALEVVEHVSAPSAFLRTLAGLLEPGGLLFLSTLNRTPRSFLLAKVGAEYIMGWLPVGTHDWRKFIRPHELASGLRNAGLRLNDIAGLVFDPLTGRWQTSRDTSVNYIVQARAE
jgi:2-polyprenyl-6-hydroxyphenyl methylase/3-demethylubiquinone-9 3-methyltransferase